jgi:hypothetical protein
MTQNPPAGWHPDPHDPNQIRYWDGNAWTEHTQPAQNTPAAAPVPPAATPAPSVAAPARPWWKKKRWIITGAVVALFVIAGIAGGGGDNTTTDKTTSTAAKEPAATESSSASQPKSDKPTPTPTPKPKAAPKPAEKPIAVTAADIIRQYQDNELAADSRYKGKKLAVTGVISKIDTEMFDSNDYTVELNGGGEYEFLTVTAYDIPNSDIAKLQKGQRVTVVCDFKDGGDLGVDVNHCKLG